MSTPDLTGLEPEHRHRFPRSLVGLYVVLSALWSTSLVLDVVDARPSSVDTSLHAVCASTTLINVFIHLFAGPRSRLDAQGVHQRRDFRWRHVPWSAVEEVRADPWAKAPTMWLRDGRSWKLYGLPREAADRLAQALAVRERPGSVRS